MAYQQPTVLDARAWLGLHGLLAMASVIYIHISGNVQTGKSATLQTIRQLLENHGYCVAVPDRAERRNPSVTLAQAEPHEKPNPDHTVFVLSESIGS